MQGFSLNGFTSGRIDGSGNLSVNVVPEPTSLLFLGSGDKELRMVGAGFLEIESAIRVDSPENPFWSKTLTAQPPISRYQAAR